MEKEIVTGIAYSRDEAKVTLRHVPDRPGVAAAVFGPLTEAHVNVDMIVQNVSADGTTDMTFTIGRADLPRVHRVPGARREAHRLHQHRDGPDVAKISVVGVGMRSHAGVANTMFRTLAERGINIQVISTSEIKVSVLIAEEYTELAVRALHTAYGLDPPDTIMPDAVRTSPGTTAAGRLDRLWARGAAFLGTRTAIMGGAMSWVSERTWCPPSPTPAASACWPAARWARRCWQPRSPPPRRARRARSAST